MSQVETSVESLSRNWALRRCAEAAVADRLPADDLPALREVLPACSVQDFEPEFLRETMETLLLGRRPSTGFIALRDAGALDWLMPELAEGQGLSQNEHHIHDIFFHCIFACDASRPDVALRLAGLLHDIGKSRTRRPGPDGVPTFHNHEVVGARQTVRILRRLGFDDSVIERVAFLVRNHMFHYTPEWTDHAVRKFMRRVNPDQMRDLIDLRIADRKASGKHASVPRPVYDFLAHMEKIRDEESRLKVRDLAIDGHSLMRLGMKPGPAMGDLLDQLLARVASGDLANESGALEKAALELLAGTAAALTGGSDDVG